MNPKPSPLRLVIGPMNTAGQASLWSEGLRQIGINAEARGIYSRKRKARYGPPDRWLLPVGRRVSNSFASAWNGRLTRPQIYLNESFKEHLREVSTPSGQAKYLKENFQQSGIVFHGSDIRSPDIHKMQKPDSYFNLYNGKFLSDTEERTQKIRELIREYQFPCFVTTPDLMNHLPGATWLPLTVNQSRWAMPAERQGKKLRVIHIPSRINPPIKGTPSILTVMEGFSNSIDFELIVDVRHSRMVEKIRAADIVIDQFLVGSYGVAAIEALAASKAVIADISLVPQRERRYLDQRNLPIFDTKLSNLNQTLSDILDDQSGLLERRLAGPRFVEEVHSLESSTTILSRWIG